MIPFANLLLLSDQANGSDSGGFQITQSLRFREGQELNRSITQNAQGTDVTFSFWFKCTGPPSSTLDFLSFGGSNYFQYVSDGMLRMYGGGAANSDTTNLRVRDPNGWYHVVINSSGDNATGRVWLNGFEITRYFDRRDFPSLSNGGSPGTFRIAANSASGQRFDGYLAEWHCVDGSNVAPTEFGEYNTDGVWIPKQYTGTHGTKGWYLPFDPDGFNGAGNIGSDHSGNGNNFNKSGFAEPEVNKYSAQVFTTSRTSPDFTSTRRNFFSGEPPEDGFNGSSASAVQSAGTADDTTVFIRFNTPISCTSIEINPTNGNPNQVHYINGTQGNFSGTGRETIYNGAAFNLETVGVSWVGSNANNGWSQMWVNGSILIDTIQSDLDILDTPTSNYSTYNSLDTPITASRMNNFQSANLGMSVQAASGVPLSSSSQIIRQGDTNTYYCEVDLKSGNAAYAIGVASWQDNLNNYDTAGSSGGTEHLTIDVNGQVQFGSTRFTSAHDKTSPEGIFGVVYNSSTRRCHFTYEGETIVFTGSAAGQVDDNEAWLIPTSWGDIKFIPTGYNADDAFVNFGQMPFIYPPTSYSKLQSNTLATPTIKKPSTYFKVIKGSGDGVTTAGANQTSGNFSPFIFANDDTNYQMGGVEEQEFINNTLIPHLAFNGTVGDSDGANGGTGAVGANWMYFIPETALTDITALRLNLRNVQSVRINGTQVLSGLSNATAWNTVNSPAATITEIAFQGGSGVTPQLNAVEINGDILVDKDIFTLAQEEITSGMWWIKSRGDESTELQEQHQIRDTVRNTEVISYPWDGTTGITTGAARSYGAADHQCVAWCWLADETWTAGSIKSGTGRRNTKAGFSMFQYDGDGNRGHQVAHGLSEAPDFFFIQCLTTNASFAPAGATYHHMLGPASNTKQPTVFPNINHRIRIENGAAVSGADIAFWNSLAPTSTLINLGESTTVNGSSATANAPATVTYQCYAWHEVPGYSKFGRYAANNTSQTTTFDGPFIYTGFKPAAIWIKGIGQAESWVMRDSSRNFGVNPINRNLITNSLAQDSESTFDIDFLCNGFKIKTGDGVMNFSNSAPYIYAAWAEFPFGGENTPPVTAF